MNGKLDLMFSKEYIMIVLRKKPSCPYSFYRKGVIITRKVIFNWMCEGKELKLLDSNGEDVTIETMKKINKVYLNQNSISLDQVGRCG